MRKITTILFTLICFYAQCEEQKELLSIWFKEGKQVSFSLLEEPVVSFTDEKTYVETGFDIFEFQNNLITKITYEAVDIPACYNLVPDDNRLITFDGEYIIFDGLKTNDIICLCSINGKFIYKTTIKNEGPYKFAANNLQSGTYLVKINNTSYKFLKR